MLDDRSLGYPHGDWDYDNDLLDRDVGDYGQPVWVPGRYWWATPGEHAGKGPKGYSRSDDQIRQEINYRLTQNGQLDAGDIYVSVIDCEVTLRGTVNTPQDKRLAEDIAGSVFGVEDVHDELRLNRPGAQYQTEPTNQSRRLGVPPSNLHQGQTVVGSQGKEVGTVKELHATDFTLDRPNRADVHVPYSAVEQATGDRVRLNVPADWVEHQA